MSHREAFTAEHLVGMKRIGVPSVSPDAKSVCYSVKELDLTAKKATTSLWVAPSSDLERVRRVTFAAHKSDTEPIWYVHPHCSRRSGSVVLCA